METEVGQVEVWRVSEDAGTTVQDVVAREFPLTVVLNDRELVTLLCSPADLKHLAIGFLFSEGLILSRNDLKKVLVDETRGVVRVETTGDKGQGDEVFRRFISSGCGRGASFYSAADAIGMEKIVSPFRVSTAKSVPW